MIPDTPIVLRGKAAKEFEKYQKTPATKEEIKHFKNAEKLYLKYCPQDNK